MTPILDAIAAHFCVQKRQAEVIALLLHAGGRFVAPQLLAARLGASLETMRVHICFARDMGVPITWKKDEGYRLDREAIEPCRVAMAAHAASLRAAADELERAAA